jgi:hypothetical protein
MRFFFPILGFTCARQNLYHWATSQASNKYFWTLI